ncbi:MAG: DUF5719 family protein, partial [Actinomycetia bacterium]|nr:DUF5719 family protein [Actinomycetes bacterium]
EKYTENAYDDYSIKPNSNLFVMKHDAKWQGQVPVTNLPIDYGCWNYDTWFSPTEDELHVAYEGEKYEWDAGTLSWIPKASGMYAATGSDKFSNATIWGPTTDNYVNGISTTGDPAGNTHTAFSVNQVDDTFTPIVGSWKMLYTTDGSTGSGGGFSKPTDISTNKWNSKNSPVTTANSEGGILVTWQETFIDEKKTPNYQAVGDLLSRYKDDGGWGGIQKLNQDILASSSIRVDAQGEQQIMFDTKKVVYHKETPTVPAHLSESDYKKYFTQSSNGAWSTEMVSNLGVDAWAPPIRVDGNNRVFALFNYGTYLKVYQQRTAKPRSKVFYFAEGTTRTGSGFKEWICLQNPGNVGANVTITYMLGTGENKEQPVVVGPHSRLTVDVNAAVGENQDVSAKVESDQFIVAERPMYFSYGAAAWTGGHDVVGSIVTSQVWFFAEGCTRGGFDQYLCLQNPNAADATVDITYMLGDGSTVDKQVKVGKKSRQTVNVRNDVGEDQDVSAQLLSNVGIVAERPMYFAYGDPAAAWTGGHDVMGATAPQNQWYFAEGTTRAGFDTYLCLQNPNPTEATVNITYIMGDGTTQDQGLTVGATTRETIKVNDVIGPDKDVSMAIDSSAAILAERPMYFNYKGDRPGGHVTMGALSPRNGWFFAEGTTRNDDNSGYFDEWLCLQNPGVFDANVTLSYMLANGSVIEQAVTVPKQTRFTVDVNAAVGEGQDVSVSIWSDQGIIAERPMYFRYMSSPGVIWPGGHVVMGL